MVNWTFPIIWKNDFLYFHKIFFVVSSKDRANKIPFINAYLFWIMFRMSALKLYFEISIGSASGMLDFDILQLVSVWTELIAPTRDGWSDRTRLWMCVCVLCLCVSRGWREKCNCLWLNRCRLFVLLLMIHEHQWYNERFKRFHRI